MAPPLPASSLPGSRVFVFIALAATACSGGRPPRSAEPPRPTLLVMVVVDQMRGDYLDRYGGQWTRGLRRLLDEGARYTDAAYPYLGTVTCAGHATIGTGALPWKHGMVLNAWWDRTSGKTVPCTQDADAAPLAYGGPARGDGNSGRNLAVPTLADELSSQLTPGGRVVALSLKPRSAIGLAGHGGDLVAWLEGDGPASLVWTSSRVLTPKPAPWVERWAAAHPLRADAEPEWRKLLPDARYLGVDDAPAEQPPPGWTRSFPHAFTASATTVVSSGARSASPVQLWESSPAADRAVGELAMAAVTEMGLGRGPAVDYLGVSFSSLDIVGHAYGPRSHEVQDVLARLDGVLGSLLDVLDRQVGRGRYLLALSADHGVAAYPEELRAGGGDAGRVSMQEVKDRVEAAVARWLGPGRAVDSVQYTDVYLAPGVADKLRARAGAMADVLDAVRSIQGVEAAFSSDELTRQPAPGASNPLRDFAARSHFPARSGDLVLVPRANWITVATGTTHGSHHDYDTHVPLLLFGNRVSPGARTRPVTPADVAPTLARSVGIVLPEAEGRSLDDAFAPPSAK